MWVGWPFSRTTPGRYLITFDVAFSAQPTVVASRVYGDPGIDAGSTVAAGETAVVDLVMPNQAIVATAAVSGALADGGFTFIAIGPR